MPPALAGEKGINVKFALAKKSSILAKSFYAILIVTLQLKLEAIYLNRELMVFLPKQLTRHIFNFGCQSDVDSCIFQSYFVVFGHKNGRKT